MIGAFKMKTLMTMKMFLATLTAALLMLGMTTVEFFTCNTGTDPTFAADVHTIFASYGRNVKVVVYAGHVHFGWDGTMVETFP